MANQNGQIGVILTPERYQELLDIERAYVTKTPLNSVEEDLNSVPKSIPEESKKAAIQPTHTYEDRPYAVVTKSKIKVRGIFEKLFAHPALAPYMSQVDKKVLEDLGSRWLPVTIYKTLYENIDGEVWVRMEDEFNNKFKPVK
jgi:type II secretory pathway component HofQ